MFSNIHIAQNIEQNSLLFIYIYEGIQHQQLLTLLGAQPIQVKQIIGAVIVPRQGWQTPWRSKVMDICNGCNITGLRAIEQATVVQNYQSATQQYDRMSQVVLTSIEELDDYFATPTVTPTASIADIAVFNNNKRIRLNS